MGFLVFLSFLEEFDYYLPIRLLLTFMTFSFFCIMKQDDNYRTRQYFFLWFCLWIVFRLIYYSIFGVHEIDDSIIIAQNCDRLKEQDDDEENAARLKKD